MAQKTTESTDLSFMTAALGLAKRGLGQVWPNPSVGCVIVRDGQVIARGWTQNGGRPHAETEALGRAYEGATGATAYVTLEPCAHVGETPPCSEALIRSGVARVVIACTDPDPRVDGAGITALRGAGVEVDLGVCDEAARELNSGFFMRVAEDRPQVTLKAATSLDGRIATHTGESRWITGQAARAHGHGLRARYDAILVGAGTVITDNPQLTCRLPGLEDRSPVRIIVDGHISFPLTAGVVATALTTPTWVITLPSADSNRRKALVDSGVRVIEVPPDSAGKPDLQQALKALSALGLTRLLVEGGSRIAGALIRHGLVDRVVWFRAPLLLGGDGVPVISGFGVDGIGQSPILRRLGVSRIGGDLMETYIVERSFEGDFSDQSGVKA